MHRIRLYICMLILIGLFVPELISAQSLLPTGVQKVSGPMNVTADKVVYYRQRDRYIASGNVVVETQQFTLKCARVTVDNTTGEIYAQGGVVLTGEETTLECESLRLNRTSGTGAVVRGTLFIIETNTTIEAESIRRVGPGKYVIENGSYTTCKCAEGEKPDWSVAAEKIDLEEEGYARTTNARFRVKDKSVLRLPLFIFPVKEERQTGVLIPEVGYSSRDGLEFALPFYVAAARWWDFTLTERWLEKRGFKHELETRWVKRHEREGVLNAYYIDDWDVNESRWAFVYEGRIPILWGIDWRQDIRWMSDNEYVHDFRSDDLAESRARSLESRMIFDRDFRWGGVSLFFRGIDDLQGDDVDDKNGFDDSDRDQPNQLPRASLRTALVPISRTPIMFGVRTAYDNFYFDDPSDTGPNGDENWRERASLFTFVNTTYVPFTGTYIVPEAGWRGTVWWADGDNYSRSLAVARPEAGFRIYRKYEDKYKHTVEPRLRYIQTMDMGSDLPPPVDVTDQFEDFQAIDFNIDQHLLVRRADKWGVIRGYDFVQFEVTNRYRPDEDKFKMLRKQVAINATERLRLDADAYYLLHREVYRYVMTGALYETERGDKFRISYRYQGEDDWQFVRSNAQIQLTPVIALTYMNFINISENKFVDHGGGVVLTPPQECWTLRAEAIYHTDPEDLRFNIWLNLYGLGSGGSL